MAEELDLFPSLEPAPKRGKAKGASAPRVSAENAVADRNAPLAERMRPRTLDDLVGQRHLLGRGRLVATMVERGTPHSLLLWGPPGSGKTTLARLLSTAFDLPFAQMSAVLSGVKDLRAIVERAEEERRGHGKPTLVLIDEIHRFNKSQQDALLPHVERGTIVLVGATTENPSFEVISPLLSRTRVLTLQRLTDEDLGTLLDRALADDERGLGSLGLALASDGRGACLAHAQGDARVLLGALEVAAELAAGEGSREITLAHVAEATQRKSLRYDRKGEEHYNVISAFIKSLRGSDPDAALYYLVRMIEAGEDPLFIARRMVIFAAEDVGNADPQALQVALAVKDAVHFIGLPEGRIPLAQGVTYLATAPKSNASYAALGRATEDVERTGTLDVPKHLRNAPTGLMRAEGYGAGYQYPHDHPEHFVSERYLPEELGDRRYYEPDGQGAEGEIARRLAQWRRGRQSSDPQE